MLSVARAASFTIPSSVDSMPSEDVNGPEDQPLRFVPCAYGSSTSKPSVSLKIIASPELGRGYNNHLRKTIASPRKGRASNDVRTSAQRRGRMSPCAPLIAGASLHHGLSDLRKENDGKMCSNNQIRRTTRTSGNGGCRTRHVINLLYSCRTTRRRRGIDLSALRTCSLASTSPPGGVCRRKSTPSTDMVG